MRPIAAVIVGYLVMAIFIMITFSVTWMIVGSSFAFEPGTVNVTSRWIAIAVVLSIAGALLGGWTAAKIARSAGPVRALAALVFLLGVALAIVHLRIERPLPSKPISELRTYEAANYAVQPVWYDFALPLIGAIGVATGGAMARPRAVGPAVA